MPTLTTMVSWPQGWKNALVIAATLLLVGLAAFPIYVLWRSMPTLFCIGSFILCGLWLISFLGFWLYGRAVAGLVLLDCGRHPGRWFFVFFAAVFLVGAVFILVGALVGVIERPDIAFVPYGTSLGIFWGVRAFDRLQIRENGIWQYWYLLKWDRIKSYQWEGDRDCTLVVQTAARLPLFGKVFGRGAVHVPMEHKDSVNDLLEKYCSGET